MQIVAFGAQDVYLTGSPQITFFKSLYRRYTNFSIEAIEQTFQGSVALGQRIQAIISRNGDLLHRMYLQVNLPALAATHGYVNHVGQALMNSAEIEIGGQRIDKVYGRWANQWGGLSDPAEKSAGLAEMTGSYYDENSETAINNAARTLYLPINFWFSKGSAGQALPLIALQYHEVRVTITLGAESVLLCASDGATANVGNFGAIDGTMVAKAALASAAPISAAGGFSVRLYGDYIYLDTEERRRFAQTSHEYLIEQLQFTGEESVGSVSTHSYRLNFNHPCKAFYWQYVNSAVATAISNGTILDPFWNGNGAYTEASTALLSSMNPVSDVKLQLNGHERFSTRPGSYFSYVQPYQHQSRVPVKQWGGMYSFCLSPEEHQPSGSLNMSRVDNAQLVLNFQDGNGAADTGGGTLYVYAMNYNILRILSGMGGLAFSN